jgi:glycosyltransferase involved in cell wall biosynthesis
MRIIIFSISFCEYLIQQANGLGSIGHSVLLVMPISLIQSTVGDDISCLVSSNVEYFAYTEVRPWKSKYYTDVIRKMSLFDADILHIHDNGEMITLALILSFSSLPLVVTVHDVTTHPGTDSQIKIRRRFIKFILKIRATIIHLHGETLRLYFSKMYPFLSDKVAVVPHGSLSIFKYWERDVCEQEEMTCLFFGRMEKYRGIDNLLNISNILKKILPNIKIIVAGKGSELYKYKSEMMQSGVFEIHDAFIPDREIHQYFHRASLLLLPYHEASQSGVVSVAFSFGLPVVATRVGAIPEVVVDGKHGVIVEPNNNYAFASAVQDLLLNREKLQQMSKNCLDSVTQYDFSVLSYYFEKLYTEAMYKKNLSGIF